MNINAELDTGDILLFSSKLTINPLSWAAELIKVFTKTPYTHIGVVLKDPTWISKDLKGLYLWESSFEGTPDPQDGKIKVGVQLTPMDEVINSRGHTITWLKKTAVPSDKFTEKHLIEIHKEVYDKPYDLCPGDWIEAYIRKDPDPQKCDRMFCSAFVGLIYVKCGVLEPNTDWSILRPSDFADEKCLKFTEGCSLQKLITIKKNSPSIFKKMCDIGKNKLDINRLICNNRTDTD